MSVYVCVCVCVCVCVSVYVASVPFATEETSTAQGSTSQRATYTHSQVLQGRYRTSQLCPQPLSGRNICTRTRVCTEQEDRLIHPNTCTHVIGLPNTVVISDHT